MLPRSNSPPCPCKERRDKDGATARVKLPGKDGPAPSTMWENSKSVEAAIKRLTREIDEIDDFFYKPSENDDRLLHAGMLERKRDDMVRSTVLQMHTAIEAF